MPRTRRFRAPSCHLLAAFAVLTICAPPSRLFAQSERTPDQIGVRQVPVHPEIVQFQQITFEYQVARIADTDWGRIVIDPARLRRFSKGCEAYVNVFVPDTTGRMAWVVDNVFVAGPDANQCSGLDQEGLEGAKRDDPFSIPPDPEGSRNIPVVKHLDLRPGVEGRGRLPWISAVVWLSRSPVPNADEFLRMAQSTEPLRYRVSQVLENAEGDLFALPPDRIAGAAAPVEGAAVAGPPGRVPPPRSTLAIGPPPQPVLTKALAELGLIPFPIGVFQEATPNANAAKNQCVPAAHANALAYLEHRYNYNPNIWDLPHHHVRGIGKLTWYGDIPLWEPVPTWSIVANVDAFTMRADVFDLDTGGGTGGCANFLGLLKYLHAFGADAKVMKVRHQGWEHVIGENAVCDPGNLSIGGLQSHPEGPAPTWEWIRDQLQAGRSVVMAYGRYNEDGERTGGHQVRVYGAAKYNGKKYLYMLHDSQQGDNFTGLETFSKEVTDDHTPGAPGVPNGILEFDSMPGRQVELVISVEPKPTYIFE
jgi:hypothetical protein